MRILFVGDLGSVHTRRWMEHFSARDHEVHLLTPKSATGAPPAGITVHRYSSIRLGSHALDLAANTAALPLKVAEFLRALRVIKPDLVHVHYINEAAIFAQLAGAKPLILTAWGSDILVGPRKSGLRRAVLRRTLRAADLITCDADHMKSALVEAGASESKVEVVFFGTDVEKFRPEQRDLALRASLGAEGRRVLLSLRSLEPIYDVGTLVEALPSVVAKAPDLLVLIAGNGSQRAALEERARSLGLDKNVAFLGALTQSVLPAYLASADLYVSTALSDGGLSASTAEAMASGLPVIVTDVGNNRQWVEDGKSGLIVPAKSSAHLAEAILRMLDRQSEFRAMGELGRRTIVERNNFHVQMRGMETRCSRLLAERRG